MARGSGCRTRLEVFLVSGDLAEGKGKIFKAQGAWC